MTVADVREGGRWTLAQRTKNHALYALASLGVRAAMRLSPARCHAFGEALGGLALRLLPGSRRLAEANVARVFPALEPRERAALVRRTYRTLGGYLGDAIALLDPRREPAPLPFADGARAVLDEALATGRGVVLASAHLGPWERVATTLVHAGVPFTAVAREPYDPRLADLYERLRGARGVATIYRGAPGAPTRLVRVLRRNGVLGIPMDLASRVPSIEVPFLGHRARTAVGPARLALRTGASVVVAVPAPGLDGALELAVARMTTSDLDATPAAEATLTARINDALSARIRALPASWVWMHARW